jgi:nicotinate-nucleotide adenylyltransferase
MPRLRVGLLGGSFNPAHEGHRHLSLVALKALRLHQVWWLVSPQNPLKRSAGMAPLPERLASARAVARHPRIRVTDLERRLGTRFTVDTLAALRRRWPRIDFVWLMGADILAQLPRWRRWTAVMTGVPVLVVDRPGHAYIALASAAARRFRQARVRWPQALPGRSPPAWCFLWARRNPASATAIRRQRAGGVTQP